MILPLVRVIEYSLSREHSPLGKDHCTAGLQFYKFGFNCFTTYKSNIFSLLVKSSLVNLETIRTYSNTSPKVKVLWKKCFATILSVGYSSPIFTKLVWLKIVLGNGDHSPIVDVIKLFWRNSRNSRFPLKPKQQE